MAQHAIVGVILVRYADQSPVHALIGVRRFGQAASNMVTVTTYRRSIIEYNKYEKGLRHSEFPIQGRQ